MEQQYPALVDTVSTPPLNERCYAVEDALAEDDLLISQIEQYHKQVREKIREVQERFNVPMER